MKYIFYKLLFLSLVLISCERRPLTYDYNDTLIVDINIDWQNLSKDGELPKYLKAMFYPVDGGVVVERYLESLGGELRIPQNEYNILIYTWRINAGAQSVQYRNIKSFTTIEAFTGETSKSKEKSKINGETIILQPDNYLFSWTSYDEPLDLTKKSLEALTKVPTGITSTVLKHEINATMVNNVNHYNFEVEIVNWKEIAAIDIKVTGANGWLRLGMMELSPETYSLEIDTRRISGDDVKSKFDLSFRTFGMGKYSLNSIYINTKNHDGVDQEFIITIDDIIDDINNNTDVNNSPYDLTDEENPIIIIPAEKPSTGGGGFDPPSVDDWGNGGNHEIEI